MKNKYCDFEIKLGNKYRVIKNDDPGIGFFDLGDIVTLTRDDGSYCPYFTRESDGFKSYCGWVNLEPVAAFVIGDRVKIIKTNWSARGDRELGEIGTITRIDVGQNPYVIGDGSHEDGYRGMYEADELELVPKKPKEEPKKKVYKMGDRFRVIKAEEEYVKLGVIVSLDEDVTIAAPTTFDARYFRLPNGKRNLLNMRGSRQEVEALEEETKTTESLTTKQVWEKYAEILPLNTKQEPDFRFLPMDPRPDQWYTGPEKLPDETTQVKPIRKDEFRLSMPQKRKLPKEIKSLIKARWMTNKLKLTDLGRERVLEDYLSNNLARLSEEANDKD